MRFYVLALTLVATTAVAQGGGAFRIEETGQRFARLDDAVNAIGEGSGTIVVAPGVYPECAVFSGGNLTLRAEQPSTAIFDGGVCEGKAVLVLRGKSATVDGIVFRNVKVPDLNGAGIRLEKGDLDVVRTTFMDSETGILTASDPGGSIRIERSTFTGLGGCTEGRCSHSLYIGDYAKLTVSRVRFERGRGGHYVKSRAPLIEVLDSSFDDSAGMRTNYTIDLPNGATGLIARNTIVVGKNKENRSAVITVAPEKRENPSAGLTIEGNDVSIVPGAGFGTTFVADWSRESLKIGANTLGTGVKVRDSR
jgi:hypothetical protein